MLRCSSAVLPAFSYSKMTACSCASLLAPSQQLAAEVAIVASACLHSTVKEFACELWLALLYKMHVLQCT